jgi:hypothetical protein
MDEAPASPAVKTKNKASRLAHHRIPILSSKKPLPGYFQRAKFHSVPRRAKSRSAARFAE